jgi:tetratricopeptide (TPR) repeat protein
MFHMAFVLFVAFQTVTQVSTPVAQPTTPSEVKDALAYAEALYYSAHFSESVDVLTRIDQTLTTQSGRQQEKLDTKLRLGLGYIGLNDNAKAKLAFMALYALEPNYTLDTTQFSPKVVSVATEAKAEQEKVRCYAAQTEARNDVENGKTQAFIDLLASMGSKCTVLAALAPQAAETSFRTGITAYKAGNFSSALTSFEGALTLAPEHELAREYVDLTRSKLQVGQDRLLVQWQRDFGAHQFSAAAKDYHEITSATGSAESKTVTYVNDEYKKALSSLVDNWNRTCVSGDAATLKAISGQITDLLPEPSFGADIRGQMKPCDQPVKTASVQPPPDSAAPAKATPTGCLDMQSQLALARLKTRVDPTISEDVKNYLRKNSGAAQVRVKARINENGDVAVTGIIEGNPLLNNVVRNAVVQWKFSPIRDASGIRCVDTEIPMLLKLRE